MILFALSYALIIINIIVINGDYGLLDNGKSLTFSATLPSTGKYIVLLTSSSSFDDQMITASMGGKSVIQRDLDSRSSALIVIDGQLTGSTTLTITAGSASVYIGDVQLFVFSGHGRYPVAVEILMVKKWTSSSIFVLLFIVIILWSICDFVYVRYWRLKNDAIANNNIIQINKLKQSFWSSQFFIPDLRRKCLHFVGINIDSHILQLDNKCDEECILYSLLLNHFKLKNKYYHLKMMNLSLLYRYRATYKSKRFNVKSFRSACLGQKNVLILIKNECGNVIGAFTSFKIEWYRCPIFGSLSISRKKHRDEEAFLIRIRSNSKDTNDKDLCLSPQIFALKDKDNIPHMHQVQFADHPLCTFGCSEFIVYVDRNGSLQGDCPKRFGRAFDIDPYRFTGIHHRFGFHVELIEVFRVVL